MPASSATAASSPNTKRALTARLWSKTTTPMCHRAITCHGVHNIADPRTTKFLLNSPQLCASCHTDKVRMSKYGLNMDVYNSYVADFHGTTVTLFEQRAPDQLPNKPLCIDCHGTHKISSVKDPKKGLEVKENLLATCQKCHPGASANFPRCLVEPLRSIAAAQPLSVLRQPVLSILHPRRHRQHGGLCGRRRRKQNCSTPSRQERLREGKRHD